jgi:hypothetical protein
MQAVGFIMQNQLVRGIRCSLVLLFLSLTSAVAHAQAMVTAGRGTAVTPFAQMTLVSPDWGPTRNLGYTFGVDYTHFIRSRVQPSFELRAATANGTTVNERTYLGGFQLQTAVRRVYPYVTFLGGYAGIHYNYYNAGYTGDHALIYSLGGGVDVPVARYARARIDFTRQSWNLEPNTLNPMTLSVGIAYTLPSARRIGR